MRKLFGLAILPAVLSAHFTFVVPQTGGQSARLIISETLVPDPVVDVRVIERTKLKLRDGEGKDHELEMQREGDSFVMKLPGTGARVIHGEANLGISPGIRGPKPYLLLYYPKTVLGEAWGEKSRVGGRAVVEVAPEGEPGRLLLRLLVRGEARGGSEITVVQPDGKEVRVKTNEEGVAGPFTQSGRYAVWARYWENVAGEHEGKAYEQVRHYGMLVVDSYAKPAEPTRLPEATSSFGAALEGGKIYVYGGHIARTHRYDRNSVSGAFHRYDVARGDWEKLPGREGLQGMNLVAHEGRIYRVGGMKPVNEPEAKQEIRSVATGEWFDPKQREWHGLPALPAPRSSHDLAVVGEKLYVLGGWNLKGPEPTEWAKTMYVLDLMEPGKGWREEKQGFERRALMAAVHGGKIYVVGGITPGGAVSRDVDIYDPVSGEWKKGPALPGPEILSFAPAVLSHGETLLVSLGDGTLVKLDEKEGRWVETGKTKPRLAHRMVGVDRKVFVLGGAVKGNNLDTVEVVELR